MKGIAFIACSALALCSISGCVTYSNLDPRVTFAEKSNESIIILGVKPKYRVAISHGKVVEGKVGIGEIATLNVFPENGYIVGKVPAATRPDEYHIQMILPEGIGGFVPIYVPCGNESVVSFEAPRGKVVYLGDLTIELNAQRMGFSYVDNFEAARNFVAANYPNLVNKLERSAVTAVPIAYVDCSPRPNSAPIYIYIPRNR